MPQPIQQASVIPFRRGQGGIEICLITSMSGKRWAFPKGIIEAGDSPEDAALAEALEEAGIYGRLVGPPVGTYRYQKWGTHLDVAVYLMEVTQCDQTWQEADVRQRSWLPPDEALDRLDRPELRELLESALQRLA